MHGRIFFLLTFASLLVAGCTGGIFPTPTPLPTATPPPTETPIPSTATPPRPTATATRADVLPPAIAFALNKTQTARSMKFDFESGVTLLQGGKTEKVPGLALKGVDSTLNRQVTISGTTSDTNEFITYEVVVVGNDVFIKGISGVPGVDATQWYTLPEQAQAGVRRLPTARGLVASFDPAEVGKAEFRSAGNETLDGENCSVWEAQNPEAAQALIGVTAESDMKAQLGEIDKTEFRVWTCADGYIHQMLGQVEGHDAANPENKATVSMRFVLGDFDQALDIQPPTGALPFPSQEPDPTSAAPEPTTAAPEATNTTEPPPDLTVTPESAPPSPTP